MIDECAGARCRLWNGSAFLRCTRVRFRTYARSLGDVCSVHWQVRNGIEAAKLMSLVISAVEIHVAYSQNVTRYRCDFREWRLPAHAHAKYLQLTHWANSNNNND